MSSPPHATVGAASPTGDACPSHSLTADEAAARLGVHPDSGLSPADVSERLPRFGPNRLQPPEEASFREVFFEEIREPMILLLLTTAILYAVWGGLGDALAIFAVIQVLVGVEVFNEYRADKAIAALHRLTEPTAIVRRAGEVREIPAAGVVPGDVILLQPGRLVPADARLLQAFSLSADESVLTGESLPVEKDAAALLPEASGLSERRNLVFTGTTITRGRGTAVVVATGMETELGRVARLTKAVKEPPTPLQATMRDLTRWMVFLAVGFSSLVPLLGWLRGGQSWREMLLTGLSLAFATIPEELPIIITMVLALGAWRLSRQRAIVKRLRAAETLGAVTVIATDKTGTLTANVMKAVRFHPPAGERQLLEIGVRCNDATQTDGRYMGDPLDVALLRAAETATMDPQALRRDFPLCEEFTFDNVRKRMSTVRRRDDRFCIAVKGAPEAVLDRATRQVRGGGEQPLADQDRRDILAVASQMAGDGLRVLAFAGKSAPEAPRSPEDAETDLTFVGLAGFEDPPRPEIAGAIQACRTAGIHLLMITGDHPRTAQAIARQVGLSAAEQVVTGQELQVMSEETLRATLQTTAVYARTTPEHKLRIVRALRERGEVVAVTGDGINDAPALVAADIGVAMGETGSDVARGAADIVLADNNFATIVHAVEQGRIVHDNLKKGMRYYLACKVALISASLLPVLLAVPVPFAPIQIILMELFMDLAASAAFVAEPAESNLMSRPPRDPKAAFMDWKMTASICAAAFGLFAAVTTAYLATWYRTGNVVESQTVAFVSWLVGHVLLALNLRSESETLGRRGWLSNRIMVGWGAATIACIFAAMLVPPLRTALKISP
ncbi:MAG: cation-translocating P-type ATPase, partial [Deltaproteobacteria bacterium]